MAVSKLAAEKAKLDELPSLRVALRAVAQSRRGNV
jgi:hypothetical protein